MDAMPAVQPAPVIDVQIVDHPVRRVERARLPHTAGGECVFLGSTRADVHPVHGALRRLTYHAYAPLAKRTITELAKEACRRFDCSIVRIHHALGDVGPGEVSVLVETACSHRDQAFSACRFLIDRLKETAPIWKRETWADGTTWSRGNPVVTAQDTACPDTSSS